MGAPLMKLFKANEPRSEEDRARDNRLNAIASRYRPDPSREESQTQPPPEGQQ